MDPKHTDFLAGLSSLEKESKADKLWPGYRLLSDPVLIYFEEDGQSVLVGHPKPPEGFSRIQAAGLNAYHSVSFPRQINTRFFTGYRVNGVPTNIFILPPAYSKAGQLAFIAHEVFHTYQNINFKLAAKRCAAGEEALALMFIENYLAAKMALFPKDESLVGDFLAIRKQKYALAPDCKKEDSLELGEGTANYVELKSYGADLPQPGIASDSVVQILAYGFDPDGSRFARSYGIGAVHCFVLDRLYPGWYKEAEEGSAPWELLAKTIKHVPTDLPALCKKYDFKRFLAHARGYLKAAALEKEVLLKEIESYGGYKLRFRPATAKMPLSYTATNTRYVVGYTVSDLEVATSLDTCYKILAEKIRMVLTGKEAVFHLGQSAPEIKTDSRVISGNREYSGRAKDFEITGKNFSLKVSCAAELSIKGREIFLEISKDVR